MQADWSCTGAYVDNPTDGERLSDTISVPPAQHAIDEINPSLVSATT